MVMAKQSKAIAAAGGPASGYRTAGPAAGHAQVSSASAVSAGRASVDLHHNYSASMIWMTELSTTRGFKTTSLSMDRLSFAGSSSLWV